MGLVVRIQNSKFRLEVYYFLVEFQASRRESNSTCNLRVHDVPSQKPPVGGVPLDTEMNKNIYRYLDSLKDLIVSDEPLETTSYEEVEEQKPKSTKSKKSLLNDRATQLKKWEGRVYSDEVLRKEIMGIRDVQRYVKPWSNEPTFHPIPTKHPCSVLNVRSFDLLVQSANIVFSDVGWSLLEAQK